MTAVVLVGHGSKARGFDTAMKRVARDLRRSLRADVRCAYLEINPPSIPEAIRQATAAGANDIRVLPYFLLSGRHTREDIPRIIRNEKTQHEKSIDITLCKYLGYDKNIVQVVRQRIREGRS